jgi:cytochrome oxidase Cu insertion factor (SCO1/SenC/PrrC family)
MSKTAARSAAFSFVAAAILTAGAFAQANPPLGPVDGLELPPTEIDRVSVGAVAPDFSLAAMNGDVVTLSDFRGKKNIVLVFYRGHW